MFFALAFRLMLNIKRLNLHKSVVCSIGDYLYEWYIGFRQLKGHFKTMPFIAFRWYFLIALMAVK